MACSSLQSSLHHMCSWDGSILQLYKLAPHLHWPMTTVSPSVTRKQGETCAAMLPCRFSYLQAGSA